MTYFCHANAVRKNLHRINPNPSPMKLKHSADIIDYLTITLGVLVYAMVLAFTILPYKLTSGGVAGIGTLVFYATGFEVQNTFFIINVALLIAAVKELGWKFCLKTIYATGALTVAIWFAQRVYEWAGSPMIVGDELFLATILAAIGTGTGLAICFMAGGSTGGTDIIAAIINKYRNMSIGRVIMVVDIAIISCCYFVFHDIQRVMFGYVLLVIASLTLDYWLNRSHQSVEFKIYSRNPNPIAEAIINSGRGVTMLNGMGYYTKSERKVLISVVNRRERIILFRLIKSIDPYAFVTMGNVSGVWGEGFDRIESSDKGGKSTRHVLVMATQDEEQLLEARRAFGDEFEIRSLQEIGCDVEHPINKNIVSEDAVLRARTVKYFYGYDCITVDQQSGGEDDHQPIILITGKAAAKEYGMHRFATYAEAKTFFKK